MTTNGESTVPLDWAGHALVLIDLQRDFWPDEIAAAAPALPGRVTELLASARSNGLRVVHVRARFAADGSDWMARYRLRGRIPCIAGTPGAETLPFAAEVDGEPVIVKQSFDGFLGTGLHELLQRDGVRSLLIAGLVTSTCVLLTAATATQLGYLVTVLSDCTADFADAHQATLAGYRFMFEAANSTELAERHGTWNEMLRVMHPPT
jgi:nicotinamidase-related amidase